MTPEIKQRIEKIRRGEVPEGYKRTKVGIVPDEWKLYKLCEISEELHECAGDSTYETLSISAGIGFVNQANKFGKEISGAQYSKYTVLKKGDFSYNKGNSKKYPQGCIYQLKDREAAAVPNVFESFRLTKGNNDFFEQLFMHGFLNSQLFSKINHGVRDDGLLNLRGDDFYSSYVLFPPRPEQEKIAEILSAQDKLIALKEKLIEEKKRQKKSLMQQLLTEKKRLPGFSGEWKKYNFHQIFETVSSRNNQIKSDEYLDNAEYPVVDQGKKKIIAYSNKKEKLLKIPKDGIIVFGDHTREVKYIDFDFIVGADGTQILKSKTNNISTLFLYYALASKKIKSDGYSRHLKYVKELIYRIPEETEQKAIVDIFRSVDKEIEILKKDLDQEKQKKKALMQLLLTGIVRV